jgi:Flp pilus assembly pilin Flp
MSYAEFQADWEQAAAAEYARYLAMPTAALIAEVSARRYGECYQLWRAISARANLAEAGWVLLDVVRRGSEPYLIRYHAAAALLGFLGNPPFEPAELAREHPQRAARLDEVERILREQLQPRGA